MSNQQAQTMSNETQVSKSDVMSRADDVRRSLAGYRFELRLMTDEALLKEWRLTVESNWGEPFGISA